MTKSVFRAERWVALTAAAMFALQACGGGGGGSSSPPPPPPAPTPSASGQPGAGHQLSGSVERF